MDRDSSAGIATGYGLGSRGYNPSRTGISAFVQTGPGAHATSYTMGTGSFSEVKWPGRGVDRLPNLAPRLKKE